MGPANDVLQERPLGKAINNVKNNGPELLDHLTAVERPSMITIGVRS
jgi:hypothetical protein